MAEAGERQMARKAGGEDGMKAMDGKERYWWTPVARWLAVAWWTWTPNGPGDPEEVVVEKFERRFRWMLAAVFGVLAVTFWARDAQADEEFLYRLGGGEPVSVGASDRTRTRTFGVSAEWDANLMCGRFDAAHSIGNQLNGITGTFQQVMGEVVDTAQGVVASLPALAIQRLNPGLYDLLQNGVLEASQEFRIARLRCDEVTRGMGDTLAHEGWTAVANADYWRRQMAIGGRDVLEVSEEAEDQGGDDGVTWIGGEKRGGAGQVGIRAVADVAGAGMNLLLGRPAGERSDVEAAACGDAAICRTWSSPAALEEWVTRVVGDVEVATCEGCEKVRAQAGLGLASVYREYRRGMEAVLVAEMANDGSTPDEALGVLDGGGGFRVSRRLIEAIRTEPRSEAVARRVAGELAVGRALEEASMARRALWAGMREPNVANNEVALRAAIRAADELDAEMAQMEMELRVKNRLASGTSVAVLQRDAARAMVVPVEVEPSGGFGEGAATR